MIRGAHRLFTALLAVAATLSPAAAADKPAADTARLVSLGGDAPETCLIHTSYAPDDLPPPHLLGPSISYENIAAQPHTPSSHDQLP